MMLTSCTKKSFVRLSRSVLAVCGTICVGAAMAESNFELRGLGPAPTGLAVTSFSGLEPIRLSAPLDFRTAPASNGGSQLDGRPAAWRSVSPLERSSISNRDVDVFPHTRQTMPLLLPDASDVSSHSAPPLRTMSGPSVGVRWKIPGHIR